MYSWIGNDYNLAYRSMTLGDTMTAKNNVLQFNIILPILFFACITRIAIPPMIGHPVNFSPIDAIALLCGAYAGKHSRAIFITLLSVWVSDLLVNRIALGHWVLFYQGFYWQYGCYILIALMGGQLLNKVKLVNLIFASLSASMVFFFISNLGVWLAGTLYPLTLNGLISCYIAALPFLKNTVASDYIFVAALFAIFAVTHKVKSRVSMESRSQFVK